MNELEKSKSEIFCDDIINGIGGFKVWEDREFVIHRNRDLAIAHWVLRCLVNVDNPMAGDVLKEISDHRESKMRKTKIKFNDGREICVETNQNISPKIPEWIIIGEYLELETVFGKYEIYPNKGKIILDSIDDMNTPFPTIEAAKDAVEKDYIKRVNQLMNYD